MSIVSPVQNLTPGVADQLVQPQSGGTLKLLVLQNNSTFALLVVLGADTRYQAPLTEVAYDLSNATGQPIQVNPVQLPPDTSTVGQLLATWYTQDEPQPSDTWPMALSGPASVAAETAAALLASGIPNVLTTTVVLNKVRVNAGTIVTGIDIHQYASLSINIQAATAGGAFFTSLTQYALAGLQPFTTTDQRDLESISTGASTYDLPVRWNVSGGLLDVDNTAGAVDIFITIIGSNRTYPVPFDTRRGTTVQSWTLPSAAYVVGTTYAMTGDLTTGLQGAVFLDFRITGSTLKGDLYVNSSEGTLALASHAELIAIGGASFYASKMVAIPGGEIYGIYFACTTSGTSNVVANLTAAAV